MYVSPDEARSDLFLAAAVYVLGRLVLDLLLEVIPLLAVPILGTVLVVVLPFTYTGLVPLLLIRYRKEPWSTYGLRWRPDRTFWLGALVALPVVAATGLIYLADATLAGATDGAGPPATYVPAIAVGSGAVIALLANLARWLGLALLGVFVTVKARDAFRGDYMTVPEGMRQIGKWLAIGAGVIAALLLLTPLFTGDIALIGRVAARRIGLLLGVAAAVAIAYRTIAGRQRGPRLVTGAPSSTTRQTLLTPTVLYALGPFLFSFDAQLLLNAAFAAALVAALGLVVGALQESRRSGMGAFGLALVVALAVGPL